jgi:hypothetical protein
MTGAGDEEGQAVLAEAVAAYQKALGDRLLAAYALGSLAHGGFSPLVSDVDLAVIVDDPPLPSDPETIGAVAEGVKEGGTALHQRLSVFWGTPATLRGEREGGRFPPLDRLDLLEHGRLLAGQDSRAGLSPPGAHELMVGGAEFALEFLAGITAHLPAWSGGGLGSIRPGDDAIEEVRQPEVLVSRGVRRMTKLVLFPVRFFFTARTGHLGTNHTAATAYVAAQPAPGAPLVAAALEWRSAPPDEESALALLRTEMVPLYLHYIDDHTERLTALGCEELAEGFREWRRRILR